MTTTTRPIFTTSNDDHITAPYATDCISDAEIINWTYPTHYRPKQPIPRGAHTPSSSISSIITTISSTLGHNSSHSRNKSDASAVVARILEQDHHNGGTYLASCVAKEKEKEPQPHYPPPRNESRRALLSMANGIKAPMLLRGASTSSRIAIQGKGGQVVRVPIPPVPKPSTAANRYLHKDLPPTPPSSSSSSSAQGNPSISEDNGTSSGSAVPLTKPLNLSLAAAGASTLAAKRLSRARVRQNGGSLALSRFKAVPAPIRPPRINGPSAFNGPSSAQTSDEDEVPQEEPMVARGGATSSPMGDLPITPLDIPVDWDDLHDRWTSPILVHPEQEEEVVVAADNKGALEAFRKDVHELFAHSPSIDVRGSVQDDYLFNETDEKDKEKRHGKVMVKKELKLCLDLEMDMGKKKSSSRNQKRGYKKGESFLMMNSPQSPETASSLHHAASSIVAW